MVESRQLAILLMTISLDAGLTGLLQAQARVEGKNIRIEFNSSLHSRVIAKIGGKEIVVGPFSPSEFVTVSGTDMKDFRQTGQKTEPLADELGRGRRLVITGEAASLTKTVTVTIYDEFPRLAFYDVQYTNTGTSDRQVAGWTNQHYSIAAGQPAGDPAFWSYQGASYSKRPDWVLPLKPKFHQENFLGMNSSDYGGGTPVVDVWRRDVGIGVGHVELTPKLVSLPVDQADDHSAEVAIRYEHAETLKPGSTLKTFRTFVTVHRGDYFQTLTEYRRAMLKRGIKFDPAPASAFEPIWCAWGFGKDFTLAQIDGALPIVKKLGFGWVTVDHGWQTTEGDWYLNPKKFPHGDEDMKALVRRIHANGQKAQLWWGPLIAGPDSEMLKTHPELALLGADGTKQRITFWNGWYLCPAHPQVVDYLRAIVVKALRDWDFDGLKLDGMHMNGAAPCYNPAHKHTRPEDSVEAMPQVFKAIYDTARSVKPDVLIEWCPCGTSFNFYTLPYLNMSVASDPRGSFQIRSKGKTLKALHGDSTAYFGDHVELSTGRDDFASTIGVGGVVGTEFTWPPGAGWRSRGELTPEKEQTWAKWIQIYRDKMLSRGEYLGDLYDIGFDRPETHTIRKAENMYYSFYTPDFKGVVELRGLGSRSYTITDFVNGKTLGSLRGPAGRLEVQFQKYLLLEAKPD
jgi:alpha-galactosidase